MRIELIRRESQSLMLPLHHRHHTAKTGTLPGIISSRLAGTALYTIRVSQNPRWVYLYHIKTFSILNAMLAQCSFAPAREPNRAPEICGRWCPSKMFLYGRGVRERSEFYRLKAGYFTLKFHPHKFGYLVTVHLDSPLKNLVACRGYDPLSLDYQSSALPLS